MVVPGRGEDQEFKVNFCHMASLRPAWANEMCLQQTAKQLHNVLKA